MTRRRLDIELVRRGLVESREEAQRAIAAGRVVVSGSAADKAARLVAPDEPVVVTGSARPFVSRGGEKLHAALQAFDVVVGGRRALDAGASTGGFTDCLLQHGASTVVSVDVGYGQLHERLRTDPRVRVLDRTNVRHLTVEEAGGAFPLIVADLSFISLTTVMPVLVGSLAEDAADLILLVKPQFEAGREEVSKGRGVVRSVDAWHGALSAVRSALSEHGAAMMDAMVSPLTGADGNVEFLMHARARTTSDDPTAAARLDAVVAEAVRDHGTHA